MGGVESVLNCGEARKEVGTEKGSPATVAEAASVPAEPPSTLQKVTSLLTTGSTTPEPPPEPPSTLQKVTSLLTTGSTAPPPPAAAEPSTLQKMASFVTTGSTTGSTAPAVSEPPATAEPAKPSTFQKVKSFVTTRAPAPPETEEAPATVEPPTTLQKVTSLITTGSTAPEPPEPPLPPPVEPSTLEKVASFITTGSTVPAEPPLDESIEKLFALCDHDHDGFLTKRELKKVLSEQGTEVTRRLGIKRAKDIHTWMKSADLNKDGKIDKSEFYTILSKAPSK